MSAMLTPPLEFMVVMRAFSWPSWPTHPQMPAFPLPLKVARRDTTVIFLVVWEKPEE